MAELPRPYEHLELQDTQRVTFGVIRAERGETTIRPAHAPAGKTVAVLRVYVRPEDKATPPPYYDITQAGLYAQLDPHLARPDLADLRFTVIAYGYGAKKRYTLVIDKVTS